MWDDVQNNRVPSLSICLGVTIITTNLNCYTDMSTQSNAFSLSESEIKQLNERHIGGVDKWLRMFMGLASEVTRVENGTIYLQAVYSNKVKRSKAEIVARTWLKSPNNSFLLQADTIVVTEYTDRGKPGEVVIFKEGMSRTEAAEQLEVEETDRFGKTKWFIDRHIFDINALLEEDQSSDREMD